MAKFGRLVAGLTLVGALLITLTPAPISAAHAPEPLALRPPSAVAWQPGPNPLRQRVDALQAASFILVDLNSGAILDERDAATPRAIASTTKIATALAALEVAAPSTRIRVGETAMHSQWADETLAGILPGEEYTLEELLYALMLPSGNDAARAVAAGTVGEKAFMARMNALARRLGVTAHFDSPVGLEDGDRASAAALAVLGARLLADPRLARIVTTREYRTARTPAHRSHDWRNLNALIERYPGATGLKGGWSEWSGACLVASATRDDRRLLAVLLDAPSVFDEAAALFDWGFSLALDQRERQTPD